MTTTTEAARTAQLEKSAAGGGILANQILGARYALPILRNKWDMVANRINQIAAGKTHINTDAEYANIIARQIGELASVMAYNHPDAGRYAQEAAVNAFRSRGLRGLLDEIERQGRRAAALAA